MTTNKKIVIDSCEHCPLRGREVLPVTVDGRTVYDTCRHPHTDGMDVSIEVLSDIIHPDCPLEGDE